MRACSYTKSQESTIAEMHSLQATGSVVRLMFTGIARAGGPGSASGTVSRKCIYTLVCDGRTFD